MPSVTTKIKDMTIDSSTNKDDNVDKRSSETKNTTTNDQAIISGAQSTTCILPPMAYKDLSPQKAKN